MFLTIPSAKISIQGSFGDVLFDYKYLLEAPDYFNINPLGGYSYGNREVKNYRNSTAPQNLKVLAIGDSFALTTFPFISLVVDSMDCLDMRYYKDDFDEYYDSYCPDVVIVLVNANTGIVSENTTYKFIGDK